MRWINIKISRFRIILLSIIFLFSCNHFCEAFYSVTPLSIELHSNGDNPEYGYLTINNDSDNIYRVKISPDDYVVNENGDYKYITIGYNPRSLWKYLTLTNMEFEIVPHEQRNIGYSMQIPKALSGTYWCVLNVDFIPPLKKLENLNGKNRVTVSVSYGINIYQTNPINSTRNGKITLVNFAPNKLSKKPIFRVYFVNTGNSMMIVKGKIEIRNIKGKIISELIIPDFRSFPECKRNIEIPFTDVLEKGKYFATAMIDFDIDSIIAGETVFNIE